LVKSSWGQVGPCHLVCNNEALIKELNHEYDATKVQPNQTTIGEWDVLSEIWEIKKSLDNIIIQHIKGHSDEKQAYEKLTLLQQLNVDADKLANQYIQDNPNKAYKWVNMLPTNGAQLHLKTGTITHQTKEQVMEARNVRKQVSYDLCKKYDWESTTFETIAWEPHRRAINRHTKQKVTMVKYLNGITPV
jgi:hypothetical protein